MALWARVCCYSSIDGGTWWSVICGLLDGKVEICDIWLALHSFWWTMIDQGETMIDQGETMIDHGVGSGLLKA